MRPPTFTMLPTSLFIIVDNIMGHIYPNLDICLFENMDIVAAIINSGVEEGGGWGSAAPNSNSFGNKSRYGSLFCCKSTLDQKAAKKSLRHKISGIKTTLSTKRHYHFLI